MMLDDALSGREQPLVEENQQPVFVWSIPLEFFAYALLALVIFMLRFAELDIIPPRAGELPDLLAAWRGEPLNSPLVFWAQRIGFDLLGETVFAGRFFTVLASVGVVFSPLMFRAELGRGRAFFLTLLLAVFPPLFIASRTAEGVVWTLALAAIAVRLTLTAVRTAHKTHWTFAIATWLTLVLVTESSAIVLALMVVGAGIGALIWHESDEQLDEPFDADDTEPEIKLNTWVQVRAQMPRLPWESGLAIGALITLSISTFLVNFGGLSAVGGLLQGVVGLFNTYTADNPISAVVFYAPLTVIFGIIGVIQVSRSEWTLTDRFFTLWAIWAFFVLLLLPGLTNAHAVLLGVPLCGLASGLLGTVFVNEGWRTVWSDAEAKTGDDIASLYHPSVGRWILGVVIFALILFLSVHVQTLTREILQVLDGSPSGFFARLQSNSVFIDVRVGLLWSFVGAMFLLIGFFLGAGIWGNRTTAQGYLLGFFVFLLISQISAGWYTAVFKADNPVEAWDTPATGRGYAALVQTLDDFMMREASGFTLLPITVVRDASMGVSEDGLLGWMLKNQRVTFVDTLAEASTKPIVIVPDSVIGESLVPDLGGSYVGQRFVLAKAWSPTTLLGADFLPWWLQRQTRTVAYPVQSVTLWVRQDVFESLPISDLLTVR